MLLKRLPLCVGVAGAIRAPLALASTWLPLAGTLPKSSAPSGGLEDVRTPRQLPLHSLSAPPQAEDWRIAAAQRPPLRCASAEVALLAGALGRSSQMRAPMRHRAPARQAKVAK